MKENNNNDNQKEKLDLYTWWERLLQNIEIVINQLFSITTLIWFTTGMIIGYIGVKIAYIYLPITDIAKDVNYTMNTFLNIFTSIFNIESNLDIQNILAIIFVIGLLAFLGIPHKSKRITRILKELEITDNKKTTGNTAIYIKDRKYKSKSKIRVMTFNANGVLADDFEEDNKLRRIGGKMKKFVINVAPDEKDENKLLLYYRKLYSKVIEEWKPEYLQQDDCSLVLGKNDIGSLEVASLDDYCHFGIYGSTGSGKSVELANLLAQALLKNTLTKTGTAGTKVILAEFSKKAVDWSYWKNLQNCEVFSELKAFYDYFNDVIMTEVERRAELLIANNCKSVSIYNNKIENGEILGNKLPHWIVAIDELGQVYIPSLDTEREKLLKPIRSGINRLLTEFRFVSVHFIGSSQIPSHKIMSEEIRHLTDLKLCGISTKILSEMAIGTEKASTINKKHKGMFYTNDEERKAFQGFMFREEEIFKNYPKKVQVK